MHAARPRNRDVQGVNGIDFGGLPVVRWREVTASAAGQIGGWENPVRETALECIKGPSGPGKMEIQA